MPRFDGMNAFIRADIENLSASLLPPLTLENER